jgi:tetratricopeptide (TPR) repeat protein
MLLMVGLMASITPRVWADPAAGDTTQDRMAKARLEEQNGDLARTHRDYGSAAEHYSAAVRIDRQNAALYNKLGIAEIKLNQLRSARKSFNLALKYNPSSYLVLNNLGTVAYLEKKYKPAIDYFKQALALKEESAGVHLNLAEAWMGLGEVEYAMTEYSRALELDADILTTSQDGVQTRISTPEQRARVNYLIAKAYARRGNLEGALEYLSRAKEGHFPELSRVYKDQEFAPLWKDPRLAKIVKR